MIPTSSLRDSSPYFADFHFGPYRGKFAYIPYVNHFGAIMDLRWLCTRRNFRSMLDDFWAMS